MATFVDGLPCGRLIFSPEEVLWGVVESNGSLSVAKKPQENQPEPLLPILIDRHLYGDNLQALHHDEAWLTRLLSQSGLQKNEVLALLASNTQTLLIPKKTAQKGGLN